jgi:hypothetical protein
MSLRAALRRALLALLREPQPTSKEVALSRLRWVVAADRVAVPCGYWQHHCYGIWETWARMALGWKRTRRTYRWTVRR